MKANIHPDYQSVSVTCSCGNVFPIQSSLKKNELAIEVCPKCHPFYTGKQRIVDTQGRVERFNKRFGMTTLPLRGKK